MQKNHTIVLNTVDTLINIVVVDQRVPLQWRIQRGSGGLFAIPPPSRF